MKKASCTTGRVLGSHSHESDSAICPTRWGSWSPFRIFVVLLNQHIDILRTGEFTLLQVQPRSPVVPFLLTLLLGQPNPNGKKKISQTADANLLIVSSFARRSPASNASYSASLFEAEKPSVMACSNKGPSGVIMTTPAPAPL
ncbi:hypothetical protein L3X38_018169 [Prunus dulcis]|uniref:Uncharacterized protein n=1 Tax=Prunus dulcis TaxID=3755 RepID=A0AAD4WB94_PRUDU|nr:hypothetical protein L3X38_018169 [Prunus dulcis]